MANEAYRVTADTSLPRALRTAVNVNGVEYEEVQGQAYAAGDYVLASELTTRDRERAENGELDHLLEPVSEEEALAARESDVSGLFIPEHEAERVALLEAGHRVIEKDQVLELRSAGAEAAKDAVEASWDSPEDANPGVAEASHFVEVPSITEAQNEGTAVVPREESERVDPEVIEAQGVELPPGFPVGNTLTRAEGGDPDDAKPRRARRAKPGTSSEQKQEGQS